MPGVRFQVVHVRYWRGLIHRWSTDYQYNGSPSSSITAADCQTMLTADDKMCYGGGLAANGGTASCAAYSSSGGVPLATYVAFDADTPASWIPYSGTAWGTTTGFVFNQVAEPALLVEWAGGLSSTGKPVKFRKFYHAVPNPGTTGSSSQVPSSSQTSLAAQATSMIGLFGSKGLVMGTPAGRLAGTASVSPYYAAHQLVRGRRRKTLSPGVYKDAAGKDVVIGPLQVA